MADGRGMPRPRAGDPIVRRNVSIPGSLDAEAVKAAKAKFVSVSHIYAMALRIYLEGQR